MPSGRGSDSMEDWDDARKSHRVQFDPRDFRDPDEKFFVEPDIGDQRKSIYKALPSPPKTPRRVMKKFRTSAVFSFVCSAISFALTILFVFAGRAPGTLEEAFMVSVNTSRLGQDIILFERADEPSKARSIAATSQLSEPLDTRQATNPFDRLTDLLDPVLGNITDNINEGTGNLVNQIFASVVDSAQVRDRYQLYLDTVCEGDATIDRCFSYAERSAGLNGITNNIQSSVTIGQTKISVPLLAELSGSLGNLSSGMDSLRKTIFAFLVISLVGSGLSIITSIPIIFFPQSRLLIYSNLAPPILASTAHFLAAVILTALVVGVTGLASGIGEAVGLVISQGKQALVFVWLGWLFAWLSSVYWTAIWFVEIRTWSFVRRERTSSQRGDWKGIKSEVWSDIKGRKDI